MEKMAPFSLRVCVCASIILLHIIRYWENVMDLFWVVKIIKAGGTEFIIWIQFVKSIWLCKYWLRHILLRTYVLWRKWTRKIYEAVLERSSFQPTPISFFIINLTWALGLCVRTPRKNSKILSYSNEPITWIHMTNSHETIQWETKQWLICRLFVCVCTLKWRNNAAAKKIDRFWNLTSNEPHVTLPYSFPLI